MIAKNPNIAPCNMDESHKQCWVRKGKTQNYTLYNPTYIKFKNRKEKQRHNHYKRQVIFKGEKFVFGKGFIWETSGVLVVFFLLTCVVAT